MGSMAKTNAARELLKIFSKWPGTQSISNERAQADIDRAVFLIAAIEDVCRAEGAESDYQELLASMRAFVYVPGGRWDENAATFDSRDKTALVSLARWFDNLPGVTVSLTPSQVDALRSALQECLNIVNAEHPEGEEFFNYLRYVLSRCLELLEGESVDLFGLRSLSYEATALCIQATPRISDVRRKAWLNEAGKISLAFGGQVAAGATANVLGAGIMGLLGS